MSGKIKKNFNNENNINKIKVFSKLKIKSNFKKIKWKLQISCFTPSKLRYCIKIFVE